MWLHSGWRASRAHCLYSLFIPHQRIDLVPFFFALANSWPFPAPLQSETFSSMATQMKGSAGRLTRMAASGNKVAVLKLSGIVIAAFLLLYYGAKLFL